MALSWPFKDPDELLDYEIDWTARLSGDTIASSQWFVPLGLTMTTNNATPSATIVWLRDGVVGQTYQVLNRITTNLGRIMDQTVKIKVKQK